MEKIITILAVVLVGAAVIFYAKTKIKPLNDYQISPALTQESFATSATLRKEDLTVGTGPEAKAGDTVSVHYVGTLENGIKFDSSRDRDKPFEFTIGAGQVILGWEQGIAGMKVGGKRKLIIPPELGYGSRDVGSIPANSTLIFEVELLAIR